MEILPKGASLPKKKMKKVDFYADVLVHLNEVGILLQFLQKYNMDAVHKIGFWASIRMILPIVEAVAKVAGEKKEKFLYNHLNIKTPYLVWDMFRHPLIHGEYLQYGEYQSKQVGWKVVMKGQGHVFTSSVIEIDVACLYDKLREFLENEVKMNDQSIVEIAVGVVYSNPQRGIADDFSKL